ncbi:hypothetical protein DC498_04320 [Terrimonas sp.]|uniref:hypothetical protein n=1 Tax=Terrimonas sp. TaxID=1914338 RepID=UPI000D5177B7|nr:hypothetical protein [Terrimonas sp.]PVD53742.1 hypothetical protein DC498_04320 [Terrimonas sp.]
MEDLKTRVTLLNNAQIAKLIVYMEAKLFHELRSIQYVEDSIVLPRNDRFKVVLKRNQRKMKKRAAALAYLTSEYKRIHAISMRKYL